MKSFLTALLLMVLLCSLTFGQNSVTANSWVLLNQVLKNRLPSTGSLTFQVIVTDGIDKDTFGVVPTAGLSYLDMREITLGSSTRRTPVVYVDTLDLATGGVIRGLSGDIIKDFTGDGIAVNGSNQLYATLGTGIDYGEITVRAVRRHELDSLSSFVVTAMHKGTSASADSAFMTKRYMDSTLYGKASYQWETATAWKPLYTNLWDSANSRWYIGAIPGVDSAGDNVKVDSAGTIIDVPDPVFRFSGATLARVGTDTVLITIVGTNSIELNGDTTDNASTFHWPNNRFTGLDYLYAESVYVDLLEASYVQSALKTSTSILYPGDGTGLSYLTLSTRAGLPLYFYDDTTFAAPFMWKMEFDTLFGDSVTKSAIKNIESIRTDSVYIGDSLLTLVAGVPNWVSRYFLTTTLGSYVATINENFRDIGHDSSIAHITLFGAVSDTIMLVTGTLAGSDTSTVTLHGVGKIRGTGGSGIGFTGQQWLLAGANYLGSSLDSAQHVDADSIRADMGIKIASNSAQAYGVFLKAPSVLSAVQTFILPGTDPGGYWYSDGAGNISIVAGGPGGGGSTAYYGTVATALDSPIVATTGTGLAVVLTHPTAGQDLLTFNVTGLTESQFATDAGIATESEINDSLLARYQYWSPLSSYIGTTARNTFVGSDSVWLNSTTGVGLYTRFTHVGQDTVFIFPPSGDGMVLGRPGMYILDSDSSLFKRRIYFGNTWNTRTKLDSALVDSLVQAVGRFSATGASWVADRVGVNHSMITWYPEYYKAHAAYATWPYFDTTGTWNIDSMANRSYLCLVYDSSAVHTAADTTIRFSLANYEANKACSLLAVNVTWKCAGSATVDSAFWYKNGVMQQQVLVNFSGASITTTAINFTDALLAEGDKVSVQLRLRTPSGGGQIFFKSADIQRSSQ